MPEDLQALGDDFCRYYTTHTGAPVALQHIEQIPGGASRETYRIRIVCGDVEERLILRRDPQSSLIDTERAHEHRTYEAVFSTEIPVPEPVLLEEDARHLARPFSVTREIVGCETAATLFDNPPYSTLRDVLGRRKWNLLGQLAALDFRKLGVDAYMPVPEHAAAHELAYWSQVIDNDALHPQPIAEATRRWLERNLPPPSSRMSLVHGDYRSGNFLFDTDGEIRGVLDWEMAHIGDPLEDLAWSLDPLWSWNSPKLAGGLLPRDQAIALWEESAGVHVERSTFRWWQVFASYKALAIWISSTEDFANGASKEPILALAGWIMTDRQNRILVDRLNPASEHRLVEALL